MTKLKLNKLKSDNTHKNCTEFRAIVRLVFITTETYFSTRFMGFDLGGSNFTVSH